jgi:hypothetical protein
MTLTFPDDVDCFDADDVLNMTIFVSWNSCVLFQFLGTFTNLRKETTSFMSVCPSAWNNSAPTGRIFMKFHVWASFKTWVKKIQIQLKPDKNNGYFK